MNQTTLSPERIELDFLEALPVRRRIGSVAGILLVLFFTITTSRGKLIYDWDFTQSATDSVSNLTATFGNPAGRGAQGYTFTNVGEGISVLQTGADSVSGTDTIEMVFSLEVDDDGYQRLIDFSDFANDEGMYAYDNYFYFYDYDETDLNTVTFEAGEELRLVISRNDVTRRVTVTVNGRRAWSFVDTGGFAVFNGTDQVMNFFQDDMIEHPSGTVKIIRVYNTDLVRDRAIAAKKRQCARLMKALKKAKKSKVKSRILRAKKKLAKCKKQLRRL